MTREEFLQTGLLEQYVLGITSPEENDLVQQMLKQYPELDNDCKGLMDCMEKYARANAITPPAGLKASILGKINELDEEAPTGKEGIVASPTITKSEFLFQHGELSQ